MDNRTAADMQAHNSCCAVLDIDNPNDRDYIFQQLSLLTSKTFHITYDKSYYLP